MYGRNSYLGEGFCTHGVDEKTCKVCPVIRSMESSLNNLRLQIRSDALEEAAKLVELTTARSEGRDTTAALIRGLAKWTPNDESPR